MSRCMLYCAAMWFFCTNVEREREREAVLTDNNIETHREALVLSKSCQYLYVYMYMSKTQCPQLQRENISSIMNNRLIMTTKQDKKPPKKPNPPRTTDTDDWQSKLNYIQYLNKRQQIERSDCVVVTCSTTALQSEIVFLSLKPCQKEIFKNKSISVV